MKMKVIEILNSLVDKANEKLKEDGYSKIRSMERKIVIKFEDDGCYSTFLRKGKIEKFSEVNKDETGDIEVYLTTDTFKSVINGSVKSALNAYLTRKIKVKVKLSDKLLFAKMAKQYMKS
ncbi:MAG: sterol carrier protein [Candidatus Aenigmarchaeota archaeon]|nr:sterol carrier protein [Candidatus Aenigmarchaeota archaeon]